MILRIVLLIALILGSACVRAQESVEKTDSTIAQIVYPEKDLKLWYGSDDFRVDKFVVLPNYTLLYNKELSTFRLLDNKENLVQDEVRLLTIKTIKPYIMVVQKDEQKWALGPTTTWFTVVNDSTVMAGTVLFSGRKEVAGYLLLTIKNNKLTFEHKQFDLDSKTDTVEPKNMYLITDYADYKGAQFYSSMFVLSPTPKNKFVVQKGLYLKTAQKPLFLYYAEEQDTVRKKMAYPFQLLSTDDRLLIYDPKTELLRIISTDITKPMLLDVAKALPGNVPNGRKFGREFIVDRVTNQLYYKTLANSKAGTDQLVMSVRLEADKITLDPILRSGMSDYFSSYINNRKLFFYDSKKGYIYVTKADLP